MVTPMVLGLFFDQFNTGVVTTLPYIIFNGTLDLNFYIVSREHRLIGNSSIVWNVTMGVTIFVSPYLVMTVSG